MPTTRAAAAESASLTAEALFQVGGAIGDLSALGAEVGRVGRRGEIALRRRSDDVNFDLAGKSTARSHADEHGDLPPAAYP